MPYLLLVVEDGQDRRTRPADQGHAAYAKMLRFTEDLKSRGVLRASESLLSDANGARVRTVGGRRVTTDGPFTESKEIVGGFFLVDCATREEAIALAGECPAAAWATIEVRELGPCYGT